MSFLLRFLLATNHNGEHMFQGLRPDYRRLTGLWHVRYVFQKEPSLLGLLYSYQIFWWVFWRFDLRAPFFQISKSKVWQAFPNTTYAPGASVVRRWGASFGRGTFRDALYRMWRDDWHGKTIGILTAGNDCHVWVCSSQDVGHITYRTQSFHKAEQDYELHNS